MKKYNSLDIKIITVNEDLIRTSGDLGGNTLPWIDIEPKSEEWEGFNS